jgi:hypothetical protein
VRYRRWESPEKELWLKTMRLKSDPVLGHVHVTRQAGTVVAAFSRKSFHV